MIYLVTLPVLSAIYSRIICLYSDARCVESWKVQSERNLNCKMSIVYINNGLALHENGMHPTETGSMRTDRYLFHTFF